MVNEVKIENRIGDAIVQRIVRAYRERTPWKCCIVIPLLPGRAPRACARRPSVVHGACLGGRSTRGRLGAVSLASVARELWRSGNPSSTWVGSLVRPRIGAPEAKDDECCRSMAHFSDVDSMR